MPARSALPPDYQGDGENMLDAFQGQPARRTRPVFWDWIGTDRPPANWCRWAVRDGDWKLITDDGKRIELYRISGDGAEANNVAKENPEMVRQLTAKLDAWKASLPKTPPANCISKARPRAAGDQ